jgi:hypothetical protein
MTWRTTIVAGPYFSVQVAAENRADEDAALPMMSSIMYYVASPFGFALAGLLPNWAYRPAVATWQGLTLLLAAGPRRIVISTLSNCRFSV